MKKLTTVQKLCIEFCIAMVILFGIGGITAYRIYTAPINTEYYVEDSKGTQAELGVVQTYNNQDDVRVYISRDDKWYPAATKDIAVVSIHMQASFITGGDMDGLDLKTRKIKKVTDAIDNTGKTFKRVNGKAVIVQK